jgi:D-alanyl-D-alanine carboxypeptidase
MQKNTFVFLIVSFFYFQQAFTQNFNKDKLDSLFDGLSIYNKSMGTVVIVRNDTVIYNRSIGYGVFSNIKKELLSEKSRYRIGSITKMFTAIMIFQLIEEHKLSLTTSLSVYFPQIPNSTKITIANLLSHRSGLYSYTNDWDSFRFNPHTEEQMLQIIAEKKVDFEPDTKTAYSNSNYLLLGYIVEKICKSSYAEEVQKRITSKIGLMDTYYGGKVDPDKQEVYSYSRVKETWIQLAETDMSVAGGTGAMVSTARDLSKFIVALFSHKLINNTSLQQMLTIKDGEGLGIEQFALTDELIYGHSGIIDLFQSCLLYIPNEKVVVAYTSNGYGGLRIIDIIEGIIDIYFNEAYSIPNFKPIQLSPEELNKYIGVYTCLQPSIQLTITNEGNELIGQATGQSSFPLEAIEKNKFQFNLARIVIEFFPDKNELLLHQGRGSYTFTREK